ncbi:MAG: electron transfer flavoprotein-ubiquinone oxidoreductase, partial [Acidilobaceae archaeon]
AEGVNRLLLEKIGLVEKLNPDHVALGVKEVLSLNPSLIEERFMLGKDEGLAWFVAGDVTLGLPGGGFIYTMRDSISIGLVLPIGPAARAAEAGLLNEHVSRLVEAFRLHPYFRNLWREADVIEYGGRMTIEAGLKLMPRKLYMNGLLVVGDAAGFLVNTGYTIRGVDMAVTSGRLAAEALIGAFNSGGPTEENLKSYEEKIRKSYIYRELENHSGIGDVMSDPFFFQKLPQIILKAAGKLFEADYEEPKLIRSFLNAANEENISLLKTIYRLGKVAGKL